MRTIIVDVSPAGSVIELKLVVGRRSGQAVLVLTDDVHLVKSAGSNRSPEVDPPSTVHESESQKGFPPRRLTEQTIVQILREHGGSIRIRDGNGWNIYDEIAARLGVSIEARTRITEGTGEAAWRPEVGFCRKNLVEAGILKPTEDSGRGVWALKEIGSPPPVK